ncbi:hypothetical protein [Pseudomonas gelidaquae]|uniref:hypothetical protein n=1 Tax=Pseudomonas sp. IB20 TaxID=1702250 RepID=UPI0012D324CE|nr:hypothetical protein [Pseudomonas sp. IB20]
MPNTLLFSLQRAALPALPLRVSATTRSRCDLLEAAQHVKLQPAVDKQPQPSQPLS